MARLQELFDEWVVPCWQTRPHEDLSHTWGDGRDPSPSEMYAACVGISGYVPLPLTGNDYIELLPTVFRTVNDYGLTIDNRTYVGIIHGATANPRRRPRRHRASGDSRNRYQEFADYRDGHHDREAGRGDRAPRSA
jgi:hypothetical protein